MRNPRLAVIGASGAQLAQIKILLANKGIDLVGQEEADATVDPEWVLSANDVVLEPNRDIDVPEVKAFDSGFNNDIQHWRGGSRGKGGKVKYTRN
tara:strand:- start:923 stop:1207 length:285 start_codon:yes stop_codon:yes gene_type:complete